MIAIKRYWTSGIGIFCVVFGLLACASRPVAVAPQLYDLGPVPGSVPAPGGSAVAGSAPPAALYLAEVQAPSALDSAALVYRLLYEAAPSPRAYAHSRWSMPVPELVQQRLRSHWSGQRAVLAPLQGVQALPGTPTLRLELEDFSQHFPQAQQAQAVVQLRATLSVWDGGVERLVAQRSFAHTQPCASADAVGAVRALSLGLDALAPTIEAWVQAHTLVLKAQ